MPERNERQALDARAGALMEQGRWSEAAALYRQALALTPDAPVLHNALGMAEQAGGNPGAAADAFREAAGLDPTSVVPVYNLALVLHSRGEHDGAIAAYRHALTLQPDAAYVYNNLGLALEASGEHEAAIRAFESSISLGPDSPRAHFNLGNALNAAGDRPRAIATLNRATELDPDYVKAFNNLGAVLLGEGRLEEAKAAIDRALALEPDLPEAHHNLGLTLSAMGRVVEATRSLRHAIVLKPDYADAFRDLARVLKAQNCIEEATHAHRKALALAPDDLQILGSFAALLEESGEIEESRELASEGLQRSPVDPLLNLTLARCERRERRFDQAIARLEPLALTGLDGELGGALHNELGQLYDRIGDEARAAVHFRRGNELHRAANPHVDKDAFFARCERLFPPLPSVRESGEDPAPAFMIGFPRSGSTLLNQIFDSHPGLQTLEEKLTVNAVADRVLASTHRYPEGLSSLTTTDLAGLRDVYFAEVSKHLERNRACVLVDKLPLNILRVPLILSLFPDARLVLSIRHPCDVCLSCYMQNFKVNSAMANFFSLEDAARFYDRTMTAWRRFATELQPKVHAVRYESLVEDPEREIRAALEFLGCDWNDDVLRFHEHAMGRGRINTPSYHQVTQPVYQHAKLRWERYAELMTPVLPILAPHIAHFGYEAAKC